MLEEFIKDEHSLGWELKELFDELSHKMCVNERVDEENKLHPIIHTYWSILPSFFKLYSYLLNDVKQNNEDFDFKIIFRTFGGDHKVIYDEFAEFWLGKHPIFKNAFPEENIHDIQYANWGNIIRSTNENMNIILVSGMFPHKELIEKTRSYIFDPALSKEEIKTKVLELLEVEHSSISVNSYFLIHFS